MAIDTVCKRTITAGLSLFLLLNAFSLSAFGADSVNSSIPSDDSAYFTRVYVDGFSVNSNGFKLILRTYERHQEVHFKPFLADIEYVLMAEGRVIYSKRVEQVPLSPGSGGEIELDHHGHAALEAGKNYTGMAKIYLYSKGTPEYYLTASSNFTARNDADITEVYGDSIGASATIKSKSMVPLDAKIIFTLRQDGRIIETKEIAAPSIMSNDKEKTVNVLWNNNLNEGTYMVSVLLGGNDITVNHDKIFTVEIRATATPKSTAQPGNSGHSIPGFTLVLGILAISTIVLIRRRRR
ncbi:MAG: hypothetical protein PHH85_06820 [Candidatus Methanoperedens sp.]|nr:hypothetical protein [Candidatus Methanoperedens sp.]